MVVEHSRCGVLIFPQMRGAHRPGDVPHHAPCSLYSINKMGKKYSRGDERYEMDKGMEEWR
jgi:hypothetical protein